MSTGTLSHKLFRTTVEKGLAPRQFKFVISSETVDRDRDIIRLDAWNFTEYLANPAVLASHAHERLPVGRSVDIGVRGNKVKATVEFPPKGIYEYADTVHDLVEAGFLKAASVGFRADQVEPNGLGGMTIKKATLLEWSICSIGSNPDAMVERSAPLMMQKWLKGGAWPRNTEGSMYHADNTREGVIARQLAELFLGQGIDIIDKDDVYEDPASQAFDEMLAQLRQAWPLMSTEMSQEELGARVDASFRTLGANATIADLVRSLMQQGTYAPKHWKDDAWIDIDDCPTFDVDEQELAVTIGQVIADATGEHVRAALNQALGRLD